MSKKLWMSKKDIAELLGVDTVTIDIYTNIAKADADTKFQDGKLLYAPVIVQVATKKRDTKQIDAAIKAQKLALMKLQYETETEKYIEKAKVYEEWAKRLAVLRQSLLALVYKVSKPLSGKPLTMVEVKKILMKYISEMITDYSKNGKYTPAGVEDGNSSKSKRVRRSSKSAKSKGS